MKRFVAFVLPTALSVLALTIALLTNSWAAISANYNPVCNTWVPVAKFGATTITGTSAGGNVCQFGKLVWIEGDVTLTGKNGTGNFTITGLPFTSLNDAGSGSFFSLALSNMVQPAVQPIFYQGGVQANSTVFAVARLTGNGTALGEVFLADTDFNTNSYVKFSGVYIVN